jgi:preprotein translocase subunit YajC
MQPAQPSAFELYLPFALFIFVAYMIIIKPMLAQGKKLKQTESFQKDLKRGDQVVTASGMVGTIDGLTEQFVTLEIANGVKVKFLRKQIMTTVAALTASTSAPLATSEVKKV